jgi:pimeloyl-ACP methyl ester carboxylesterase
VRGYVDTDWGQLHYRRSGSGGPAIVLLHESPRTSAVYQPVLDALGAHATTIAFDTPGFGQSDSAPADQPLAEYARILVQGLDALGVGEFVPVGMKTGSSLATAIAIALLGTGRVRRAVLYALEEPEPEAMEHWAQNWAPELPVTADGAVLRYLWDKNVGLYGTDDPRALAGCVADTLGNLERYNSIYPAVFRGRAKTWADNLALVEAGVELTVLQPPWARMTLDVPIEFSRMPGTRVVEMPVSGQFPARAPREFTPAVLAAVGAPVPA